MKNQKNLISKKLLKQRKDQLKKEKECADALIQNFIVNAYAEYEKMLGFVDEDFKDDDK